jgi:hypothetical protein
MLASDPLGGNVGTGCAPRSASRHQPVATIWLGPPIVKKLTTPALLVACEHDALIIPERGRELHADLGTVNRQANGTVRSDYNKQ